MDPFELQKAPLCGKNVGTVSFSFRPYARTSRKFNWDEGTHMSRRFFAGLHAVDGKQLLWNGAERVNLI